MENWNDKVAIVTGISSGIGADIARSLAKRGVKVVGLSRRFDLMEKLEKEINSSGVSGKLKAIKCDITTESEVASAFNWTIEHWGPPHIIVNNAAYLGINVLPTADIEKIKEVMMVNVVGLMSVSKHGIDSMVKHGIEGDIINISSIVGHQSIPIQNIGPYCASKHAVRVLSEALRDELIMHGHKIKISSISPGVTKSELSSQFPIDENTPILLSQDIADAVVYLLSLPSRVNVKDMIIEEKSECLQLFMEDMRQKSKKQLALTWVNSNVVDWTKRCRARIVGGGRIGSMMDVSGK